MWDHEKRDHVEYVGLLRTVTDNVSGPNLSQADNALQCFIKTSDPCIETQGQVQR